MREQWNEVVVEPLFALKAFDSLEAADEFVVVDTFVADCKQVVAGTFEVVDTLAKVET